MAEIHDKFKTALLECGFKKDYNKEYDYIMTDGTWFYHVNFEGYAYVLYKTINLYVKPLMSLFKIYNKFKKGHAKINLYYQVPICDFRDPEQFKIFINIIKIKI